MPINKRTKGEYAFDMQEEARMYFQGMSYLEIAEKISASRAYDITEKQVGYDIRKLKKQWHKEAMADIGAVKARDLAELRHVQTEAWRAWYRSIGEFTDETVTEGVNIRRGNLLETKTHTEQRVGDSKFLNVILRTEERIAKLYGLDAPQVHEINWRQQLEDAGIPASAIFEKMVETIMEAEGGEQSSSTDDASST